MDDPITRKMADSQKNPSRGLGATELDWSRQKGIQTYNSDLAGERREGYQEGQMEALREIARRMLTGGIRPEEVVRMTLLAPEMVATLDEANYPDGD